jgi:hypothetical protein
MIGMRKVKDMMVHLLCKKNEIREGEIVKTNYRLRMIWIVAMIAFIGYAGISSMMNYNWFVGIVALIVGLSFASTLEDLATFENN